MQLLSAGEAATQLGVAAGTPAALASAGATGTLRPDCWRASTLSGRDAVLQLGRRTRGKSIVDEDLNFTAQKKAMAQFSPKATRIVSGLYAKYRQLFEARCFRAGVELIGIAPAYTSTIGAVKYASRRGCPCSGAGWLLCPWATCKEKAGEYHPSWRRSAVWQSHICISSLYRDSAPLSGNRATFGRVG